MKSKFTFIAGVALAFCQLPTGALFAQGPDTETFTLQLLHASDLEGGVNAITRAKYFAAIVDGLEDTYPNTIKLSAGDNYIPSPFFNAASDPSFRTTLRNVNEDLYGIPLNSTDIREGVGRADVTIMNILGLDASALGNHEFDAGTTIVQELLNRLYSGATLSSARWFGTQFPYLSANLNFANDPFVSGLYTSQILNNTAFKTNPSNFPANSPKIAPATLIERNGELIGVVGATTQVLATISSPGGVQETSGGANNMVALAAVLQPVINNLIAAGANKIVLVSHLQQFAFELQLAGLLTGVDIIIAGGSDSIFANPENRLADGAVPAGEYPQITQAADGNPVLLVSTDGEYSYVGRLVVTFDANGVIDLTSLDPVVNGPYIADLEMVNDVWMDSPNAFLPNTKYDLVDRLTTGVLSIVIAKDGNIVGKTDVYLEGDRAKVRTQETNMGNISADANLYVAKQFDPSTTVSIKNGGGIRAAIGEVVETSPGVYTFLPPQANPLSGKLEKEVSQLDIENSLRFNNLLSLVTVSAAGLRQLMEHGFAATNPGVTPGQFPQIGGLKVSFDPALTPGARIRNMVIVDEQGLPVDSIVKDGAVIGDPNRTIRVVTLNFLAGGGDGYPFPAVSSNRVDLNTVGLAAGNITFAIPGSEQDAIAEYLFENFSETPYAEAETGTDLDTRIQILSDRNDEVYFFCIEGVFPAPGNPRIVQSSANNFVVVRWNPAPGTQKCLVKGGKVGGPLLQQEVVGVNGNAPDRLRVPKSMLALGQLHYFNVTCSCSLDPEVNSAPTADIFFIPLGNQPTMLIAPEQVDAYMNVTIDEVGMSVYPNPAEGGNVQIALSAPAANAGIIEVFDMAGRRVYSHNTDALEFQNINIDVQALPSGIYSVVFTGGETRFTEMLMVK
jgi:2',3'-cyclic-nucleotide 2'-phosphodiesterase (5'-nucleotidase family)